MGACGTCLVSNFLSPFRFWKCFFNKFIFDPLNPPFLKKLKKMIFLKKHFQNRKRPYILTILRSSLYTKHVPHPPKGENFLEAFCDIRRRRNFKKGGLRGSKNENFEKIPPKPKRASKIGY